MIWFAFPDTWGLPLEEIAAIFGVSVPSVVDTVPVCF